VPPVLQSFEFGVVRADLATQQQLEVPSPVGTAATVELLAAPPAPFAAETAGFPIAVDAGGSLALDLSVIPDVPGERSGSLRLLFVEDATGETREVVVSLSATIDEPQLVLLESSLDFGDVRIGASQTLAGHIRNYSAATPLTLESLSGLPAGFTYEGDPLPVVLPAGAVLNLPLRYEPDVLADLDFSVAISRSNGADLTLDVRARTTTWMERTVIDFGSAAVAATDTEWFEVELPPHAISLSVEAIGPADAHLGLSGFEGPGGVVYENDSITGDYLQFPNNGIFTATLPNSDRDGLRLVPGGGTYRFRIRVFSGSASTLDVRAIVLNRLDGVVTEGRLDLNIFLVPGLGLAVQEAATEDRLQTALAEADRIFSQQGLRLGAVSYYTLSDPAFNEIGSYTEFATLVEESSAATETRLNLFMVQTAIGGGVLGVAARVAGPARNGTDVSGVMVDYDYGTAATLGYVIAHEIGHFVGLLHTVEQTGSHDLIDDTAECPESGTSGACPTEGNDYLMHWRVLTTEPVITDSQARIILGHPLMAEDLEPLLVPFSSAVRVLAAAQAIGPLPEGWCGCVGCSESDGR